jgi:hypothetical protein
MGSCVENLEIKKLSYFYIRNVYALPLNTEMINHSIFSRIYYLGNEMQGIIECVTLDGSFRLVLMFQIS